MRHEEKSDSSRYKINQISPHSSFEMTKFRLMTQPEGEYQLTYGEDSGNRSRLPPLLRSKYNT